MHKNILQRIWIFIGISFLLCYICLAFYLILQMDSSPQPIWNDQISMIASDLKAQVPEGVSVSVDEDVIQFHTQDHTYTFQDDKTGTTQFTKEVIIEDETYSVRCDIDVDFDKQIVDISTKIDEWLQEKNKYQNLSIGYNTYSLDDLDHPINDSPSFVDTLGKASDQHNDIKTYVGFDEIKDQIKQIAYYHELLTSNMKKTTY